LKIFFEAADALFDPVGQKGTGNIKKLTE